LADQFLIQTNGVHAMAATPEIPSKQNFMRSHHFPMNPHGTLSLWHPNIIATECFVEMLIHI